MNLDSSLHAPCSKAGQEGWWGKRIITYYTRRLTYLMMTVATWSKRIRAKCGPQDYIHLDKGRWIATKTTTTLT